MTEITELKIAPKHRWRAFGKDNPLRCTISLRSEDTTVEPVLSEDDRDQLLALVSQLVSNAAARNVAEFQMALAPAEGSKDLIEGEVQDND